MPQLDPAPWFPIFALSWFAILFIIAPKVLARTFLSKPTLQSIKKPKTEPWNWPWH
uniref:ATP synthase complex subunit 8 n=1 Tax=Pelates quadrilineatus TaxID=546549 RepID=A0A343YND8_9TELE|nr:ATP synthase subunit 8 [Pelates quadrilineatus]